MKSNALRGITLTALIALTGCAAPVGEQMQCSTPIATIQTEPENHCLPFPQTYYGIGPQRMFLRGGNGSTPLRYQLRVAGPAAVGERLSPHPATLPNGEERLVATETYGLWR